MALKENFITGNKKWIDLQEPTATEVDQVCKEYGLEPKVVRDSMDPEHLPKYELMGNKHFLMLRLFNHSFDKRIATIQDMTSKIAIFYNDDFLVTIHRIELHFLDMIRKKFVENNLCTTPGEIVSKIMWYTLETFVPPVQRLSEQIDFYETHMMLKGITHEQLEGLYIIKRQVSMCNKILVLLLEPLNHISTIPGNSGLLQDIRDQHVKVQTMYGQEQEDINNLVSLYMSLSAQKTNDIVKVLTIFSVFFMPITFIAGLYGMNFQHMPELGMRWGYPAVLVAMLVITIGIYYWFRKKKWL